MLPTSYIGGRPTNGVMFLYHPELGETILDCQFMKEFLRPWNSSAVKDLVSEYSDFNIMIIFFFVALPLYFLVMELVNRKILKNNDSVIDQFVNDPERLSLRDQHLQRLEKKLEAKRQKIQAKIERLKNRQ